MPFNIPYGTPISYDRAQGLIKAAVDEATKRGWAMNVAVVDPNGDLIAFGRMDGAQLASVPISQHKARTAARYRRPTRAFEDAIQKFGDMMGKQRSLLDKTFRQSHGQGDPKDGGAQGLSKQQGDLQNQLDNILKGLDPKLADKLKGAGKAMGDAKGALGQKDFDNAGNAEANRVLSEDRAASVRDELIRQGITADRIETAGVGSDDPVAKNDSRANMEKNRRIDVIVVSQ